MAECIPEYDKCSDKNEVIEQLQPAHTSYAVAFWEMKYGDMVPTVTHNRLGQQPKYQGFSLQHAVEIVAWGHFFLGSLTPTAVPELLGSLAPIKVFPSNKILWADPMLSFLTLIL